MDPLFARMIATSILLNNLPYMVTDKQGKFREAARKQLEADAVKVVQMAQKADPKFMVGGPYDIDLSQYGSEDFA